MIVTEFDEIVRSYKPDVTQQECVDLWNWFISIDRFFPTVKKPELADGFKEYVNGR